MSTQLFNQKATRERLGGIGLTKLYELWGSGELGSVYIGKRRYSSDNQISDYIQRLEVRAAPSVDREEAAS